MKKVLHILTAIFFTVGVLAQVPEKMSYQAVVRNGKNSLVANQPIGLHISIIHGSVNGAAVYQEVFKPNPVTNANGLVTAIIGSGTPILGTFSSINWANGPYFIQAETDTTGGTNYTIAGTTQLLSVPYALHAKTAESVSGNITETDPLFAAWNKNYNDITNKPDLSVYATKEMVNQGNNTSIDYNDIINKPDLSVYATKDMINQNPASLDYNNLINKPDLTVFATKDMINQNTSNPDYNELNNKPDLSIYATKNMANQNITNLANPVNPQDAATKAYVDALLKRIEKLEKLEKPEVDNTPPKCHIYNSENSGLPSGYITSIAIDSHDNKWFGMSAGKIVKFDDVNWTVYESSETGIPFSLEIRTIAIDAQDNKWIAAYNGSNVVNSQLITFDNTNWTIYTSSNSGFANNQISEITFDNFGNTWIGTYGGGVVKFDGTNWTVYNSANSGLPDNNVNAIAIDALGNKWISTVNGGGLVKFDDNSWTIYSSSDSLLSGSIGGDLSIAIDDKGNKWFGMGNGQVVKFDNVNWTVYESASTGIPSNLGIGSIAIDANGNKWFLLTNYWDLGALAKFDGTNWTIYNSTNSCVPDGYISSFAIDTDGNIWIATWNHGVVVFNENIKK